MTLDLQLANRRALVTGGTKGVGAAVVETLCDAGAQVLAAARSAPSRSADGVRFFAADRHGVVEGTEPERSAVPPNHLRYGT